MIIDLSSLIKFLEINFPPNAMIFLGIDNLKNNLLIKY